MDITKDYHNIEQQRIDSGKSVKEFCLDRGIRLSLYYYWRKKQNEQRESKFHHIHVSSSGPGAGMRILYPNGVQLATDDFWGKTYTMPPDSGALKEYVDKYYRGYKIMVAILDYI